MITSAIEIMVRKEHINILSDPLVKTLITTKWQRFASYQFISQAIAYLIFVIVQTFLVWLHCSASQWNKSSRQALEIVSIIFAVIFLLLEFYDLHDWTVQVFHRRDLMKANMTFVPPLYPIPGEMHEDPEEAYSMGLLSRLGERLFGSKGPVPLAEGVEGGTRVDHSMEEGHAHLPLKPDGNSPFGESVEPFRWWQANVTSGLPAEGRNIAEGHEPGIVGPDQPTFPTPHLHLGTMIPSPAGSQRGSASELSDAAVNGTLLPAADCGFSSSRSTPFKSQGMFPVDIVSVGLDQTANRGLGMNYSFAANRSVSFGLDLH